MIDELQAGQLSALLRVDYDNLLVRFKLKNGRFE